MTVPAFTLGIVGTPKVPDHKPPHWRSSVLAFLLFLAILTLVVLW